MKTFFFAIAIILAIAGCTSHETPEHEEVRYRGVQRGNILTYRPASDAFVGLSMPATDGKLVEEFFEEWRIRRCGTNRNFVCVIDSNIPLLGAGQVYTEEWHPNFIEDFIYTSSGKKCLESHAYLSNVNDANEVIMTIFEFCDGVGLTIFAALRYYQHPASFAEFDDKYPSDYFILNSPKGLFADCRVSGTKKENYRIQCPSANDKHAVVG